MKLKKAKPIDSSGKTHAVHVVWPTPHGRPVVFGPSGDEYGEQAPMDTSESRRRSTETQVTDQEKEEAKSKLDAIQRRKKELEDEMKRLGAEEKVLAQDLGRDNDKSRQTASAAASGERLVRPESLGESISQLGLRRRQERRDTEHSDVASSVTNDDVRKTDAEGAKEGIEP